MTARLNRMFARLRSQRRAALIMYAAGGDPAPEATTPLMHALAGAGVDVLELGYPFSDPILDGAVIQQANRRALDAGMNVRGVLKAVELFRRTDVDTPVVLMGYFNPILAFGPERFAWEASAAGIDGVIVADLPLHEARRDLLPHLAAAGLVQVPLNTPGLSARDVPLRQPGVGGFHYCVPLAGTTGSPGAGIDAIRREVSRCRAMSPLPVAVGFGLKTPEAAAEVAGVADAAIVGAGLVETVHRAAGRGWRAEGFLQAIADYVRPFRAAMDHVRAAAPPV